MSALAKPDTGSAVAKVKDASGPLLTAGAAAVGLAGGVALGARLGASRRRNKTALQALGEVAKHFGSAANQLSSSADDVREVREQLERLNRRSPVEVLLDGLTHRRGAHKVET